VSYSEPGSITVPGAPAVTPGTPDYPLEDLWAGQLITGLYNESYPADILAPPVAPNLLLITPSTIVVNTPTPCTITGDGFVHNSKVFADEGEMPTSYYGPSNVTFTAQADSVGTQDITVHNGAQVSNIKVMTVTATAREAEDAEAAVQAAPSRNRKNGGKAMTPTPEPMTPVEPEPETPDAPEPETPEEPA
jgi:hypothetical protein